MLPFLYDLSYLGLNIFFVFFKEALIEKVIETFYFF